MDDPTKKLTEAAERLKELSGSGSALDALRNFDQSSAMSELKKRLSALDKFKLPDLPAIPFQEPIRFAKVPTFEETNHFQSAAVLLRRLADAVTQWRAALPKEFQPAVIAILNGGVQISVDRLAQESFHGIRIEGKVDGLPCMVLAHQATVQLLCVAEPIQPPEHPKRPIGFIIDGQSSEA